MARARKGTECKCRQLAACAQRSPFDLKNTAISAAQQRGATARPSGRQSVSAPQLELIELVERAPSFSAKAHPLDKRARQPIAAQIHHA